MLNDLIPEMGKIEKKLQTTLESVQIRKTSCHEILNGIELPVLNPYVPNAALSLPPENIRKP